MSSVQPICCLFTASLSVSRSGLVVTSSFSCTLHTGLNCAVVRIESFYETGKVLIRMQDQEIVPLCSVTLSVSCSDCNSLPFLCSAVFFDIFQTHNHSNTIYPLVDQVSQLKRVKTRFHFFCFRAPLYALTSIANVQNILADVHMCVEGHECHI